MFEYGLDEISLLDCRASRSSWSWCIILAWKRVYMSRLFSCSVLVWTEVPRPNHRAGSKVSSSSQRCGLRSRTRGSGSVEKDQLESYYLLLACGLVQIPRNPAMRSPPAGAYARKMNEFHGNFHGMTYGLKGSTNVHVGRMRWASKLIDSPNVRLSSDFAAEFHGVGMPNSQHGTTSSERWIGFVLMVRKKLCIRK